MRFIYIELIIDQLEDRHCLNLYKYTLKTFFFNLFVFFFVCCCQCQLQSSSELQLRA